MKPKDEYKKQVIIEQMEDETYSIIDESGKTIESDFKKDTDATRYAINNNYLIADLFALKTK